MAGPLEKGVMDVCVRARVCGNSWPSDGSLSSNTDRQQTGQVHKLSWCPRTQPCQFQGHTLTLTTTHAHAHAQDAASGCAGMQSITSTHGVKGDSSSALR